MSVKAIKWAFEQQLKYTDKLVLLTLANFANTNDKAWPSTSTIARLTGLSRRSVFEVLRRLEAKGLITRTPRRRPTDGGKTSSLCTLILSAELPETSPCCADAHGGSQPSSTDAQGCDAELHNAHAEAAHQEPSIEPKD